MPRLVRSFIASAFLLVFVCGTALSQEAPKPSPQPAANDARIDEQRAALAKLKDMIGHWEGGGWISIGPGKRSEFTQTESVQSKLDGTLLTIEGEGRDKNEPGKIVHSAFAVVTYDPSSKQYRYRAFSGGRSLDLVAEVGEHGWRWGFDMPYGKIRYTLDFSGGKWHEFGEVSRDNGQSWNQNFEMTLTRKR